MTPVARQAEHASEDYQSSVQTNLESGHNLLYYTGVIQDEAMPIVNEASYRSPTSIISSADLLDPKCLSVPDFPVIINQNSEISVADFPALQLNKLEWNDDGERISATSDFPSLEWIAECLSPYIYLLGIEADKAELTFLKDGKHSKIFVIQRFEVAVDSEGNETEYLCMDQQWILKVLLPVYPFYKVSAEAGVLTYVRRFMTVPVPCVYAYDASGGDNALGYEWILMDRLPGISFKKAKEHMTNSQLVRLGRQIADWCSEFNYGFVWGHVGSIYFNLPPPTQEGEDHRPSSDDLFNDNLFKVGPKIPQRLQPLDHKLIYGMLNPQSGEASLHHPMFSSDILIDPATGSATGLVGWSRISTMELYTAPFHPEMMCMAPYESVNGLKLWPASESQTQDRIREEVRHSKTLMRHAFRKRMDANKPYIGRAIKHQGGVLEGFTASSQEAEMKGWKAVRERKPRFEASLSAEFIKEEEGEEEGEGVEVKVVEEDESSSESEEEYPYGMPDPESEEEDLEEAMRILEEGGFGQGWDDELGEEDEV